MIFKKPTDNVQRFITQAEGYVGYTARPNRENIFGERLSLNGQPWDGMFIDVVAREVGLALPNHTVSSVALAEYIGSGFFHVRPQVGDIAFFKTSEISNFGSPHVGIVINVERQAIDGTFITVEGMTSSGNPRGGLAPDGVYKRVRHTLEVIGFGRPHNPTVRYKRAPQPDGAKLAVVVPAQVRVGIKHKNVTPVQLALNAVTGVTGLPMGHFDTRTKMAFADFQRKIGYLPSRATGEPDEDSLKALAEATGFFAVP